MDFATIERLYPEQITIEKHFELVPTFGVSTGKKYFFAWHEEIVMSLQGHSMEFFKSLRSKH